MTLRYCACIDSTIRNKPFASDIYCSVDVVAETVLNVSISTIGPLDKNILEFSGDKLFFVKAGNVSCTNNLF